MKAKVQKWGNSLGLRIPKSFAQDANLGDGTTVDIKVDGELLVVKSLKPSFKLEDLLSQITPKNIHKESATGKRVGKEIW